MGNFSIYLYVQKTIYFIGFHINIIRDDFSKKGYATKAFSISKMLLNLTLFLKQLFCSS
jgi:hypothetical protein